MSSAPALAFRVLAKTDLGLVREGNEDAALASNQIIAVADGMGGHAGGEVASRIAIHAVKDLVEMFANGNVDEESREDLFMNIAGTIDREISSRQKGEPELSGMGTTLTALRLADTNVELLHVGDSRCYQWNGKVLTQRSVDHTVMQELIDQGRLTREEALDHPQRSLLTQALMGDSGIDPLLVLFPAKIGDRFLLCSDGLSGVLSDHEIATILKKSVEEVVLEDLLSAVKAKGAPDNITILLAKVVSASEHSETEIQLLGAAE
jgi:serine/threonine protein phosphatase PrpC